MNAEQFLSQLSKLQKEATPGPLRIVSHSWQDVSLMADIPGASKDENDLKQVALFSVVSERTQTTRDADAHLLLLLRNNVSLIQELAEDSIKLHSLFTTPEGEATITVNILRQWPREQIERFALHLLGDAWQSLNAKLEAARKALVKYGKHLGSCAYVPGDPENFCTCDYQEALNQLKSGDTGDTKAKCVRCGAPLLGHGQCSRHLEGCQGGWGDGPASELKSGDVK